MKNALLVLVLFSLPAWAQKLEIITPQKTSSLSLALMKAKLKRVSVKIDDPVYGKEMEYDAFALEDVLRLGGVDLSASADEIVFVAIDGYAPNTDFAKIKNHKAFLAYGVHAGKKFPQVAQGKTKISPAPFYVVWEEGKKIPDHVPWPYQLAKIEIVDWNKKFPGLFPAKAAADSAERKGFNLFKAECIRCHSLNLQGGDLGPELNVPKNITEYWDQGVLKEFIRDNSQFRLKSKMPPFKQLSDEQLNDLLAYLRYMKGHKSQQ